MESGDYNFTSIWLQMFFFFPLSHEQSLILPCILFALFLLFPDAGVFNQMIHAGCSNNSSDETHSCLCTTCSDFPILTFSTGPKATVSAGKLKLERN